MPTIYFETLDDETVAVQGEVGDVLMEVARAEGIDASTPSAAAAPLATSTSIRSGWRRSARRAI